MDSSDFSNRREEDEDIRLFREDYPDVYNFVLKVLDGNCDDAALQTFNDDYGEASLLCDDFNDHGFAEIWLADYTGLEAYGDIELFCLYPSEQWGGHYTEEVFLRWWERVR